MKISITLSALAMMLGISSCTTTPQETLSQEEFENPSIEYRPRTWYHINDQNMSAEGFTKDLEAIKRAGLGGVLVFNVSLGLPSGDVLYDSPEHTQILTHAAKECERLGLSFGVHNCDGWTSSGGRWVSAEDAMKIVTNSQTLVKGGDIDVTLPTPPMRGDYYEDIAVVAYPTLDYEVVDATAMPRITSSDRGFDVSKITDNKIDTSSMLAQGEWIEYDYGKPYTLRSLSIFVYDRMGKMSLLASNDGVNFTTVATPPIERLGKEESYYYHSFEPTTARYFRVVFEQSNPIFEVDLSSGQRMSNTMEYISYKRHRRPMEEASAGMTIDKENIIILSANMDSNGNLRATLPKGDWTIQRWGYTLSGATNEPSSEYGRGYETDKMSRGATKRHYDAFVGKIAKISKDEAPNAMQYAEIDSYEVGPFNWTRDFDKLFEERYGYDIVPFLPMFDGKFVGNNELIEGFFWDVKRLVNDLMCENYFDYFTELCHEDGLVSYVEPYGFVGPFNSLDAGRNTDIPMGEFWYNKITNHKLAAVSTAHIYGKNVVSAEAFTSTFENWGIHPAMLKISGDYEWTNGINEYMFHRFAHQSNTHVKPGMTMTFVGSHLDRTQTWWDNAGAAWFKYLARGSYMLRQGLPVIDLLVFVGDRAPNHIVNPTSFNPQLPNDIYKYDCVNADVIINHLSVESGRLTLPDGMQYSALVLPPLDNMTIETMRAINKLSQAGALIIGRKPQGIGGYVVTEEMRAEFETLVESIWSSKRSYDSYKWSDILPSNGVTADLIVENGEESKFYHRKTQSEDIYFVYNEDNDKAIEMKCSFRVEGGVPELWSPMDGSVERFVEYSHVDGRTVVNIELNAGESTFVVLRKESDDRQKEYAAQQELRADLGALPEPISLDKGWTIEFRAEDFYAATTTTDQLYDWSTSTNDNIKYYSGTAIYTTEFELPKEALQPYTNFEIDLGDVSIAARVVVNGEDLGVVWDAPFVADITRSLKIGRNTLQLEVTNQWNNRLIGDERLPNQTGYEFVRKSLNNFSGEDRNRVMPEWFRANKPLPEGPRKTWSSYSFQNATDELQPSGLMGPVKIQANRDIKL